MLNIKLYVAEMRRRRDNTITIPISTAPAATRPIAAPTASSSIRYSDTGQMVSKIAQPITAYGYRPGQHKRSEQPSGDDRCDDKRKPFATGGIGLQDDARRPTTEAGKRPGEGTAEQQAGGGED